jgi:pyrroloquinoline quinone (PQQ) biosynthesis protein C
MNAYQHLVDAWNEYSAAMTRSDAFELVSSGRITRDQYAAILRQIFHQARENPQIQALVTARFRGEDRLLVKTFLRHATSEVGHDELALQDIEALGGDVSRIRKERPMPATFALLASVFYMIEHHDPVAYLGYLFHLEYTPVQLGSRYMEALERCGIPRAAMTFLEEHAAVDVSHCKLIQLYCDKLIRTPEQLESVLFMQRVTAQGYSKMLDEAIRSTTTSLQTTFPPSDLDNRDGFVVVMGGSDA